MIFYRIVNLINSKFNPLIIKKMKVFCRIILPLLCIISCSERKEIEVYNMKIDENKFIFPSQKEFKK